MSSLCVLSCIDCCRIARCGRPLVEIRALITVRIGARRSAWLSEGWSSWERWVLNTRAPRSAHSTCRYIVPRYKIAATTFTPSAVRDVYRVRDWKEVHYRHRVHAARTWGGHCYRCRTHTHFHCTATGPRHPIIADFITNQTSSVVLSLSGLCHGVWWQPEEEICVARWLDARGSQAREA